MTKIILKKDLLDHFQTELYRLLNPKTTKKEIMEGIRKILTEMQMIKKNKYL